MSFWKKSVGRDKEQREPADGEERLRTFQKRVQRSLERLAEQGISPSEADAVVGSMRAGRDEFFRYVFWGDEEAELAFFPKGIPARRAVIFLAQMQKYQRLHEMAAGVPDLVMREESLVRPGSGRPFAVSWLHGGGRIPHPEKWHYWHISKNLISIHGQLLEVRYLSHFPKFEIEFKYEDGFTLYSGQRTETYDLNFLSLGYTGEGPRYAGVFLAAVGFHLTPEEIDSVRPGDRITMESGKALIVRGAQGLSRAES